MMNTYSAARVAIDLVMGEYKLTEPFEIQQKIEEIFTIEIHIDSIVDYLKIKHPQVKVYDI